MPSLEVVWLVVVIAASYHEADLQFDFRSCIGTGKTDGMGLLIQFTCDRAHPHADGGSDGVACEHSRTATFDHGSETCEDLFDAFRRIGWHIVVKTEDGEMGGDPDIVLCPAHAAAARG